MRMIVLLILSLTALSTPGCDPPRPTSGPGPGATLDVSPHALCRDFHTAVIYAGHRVRVRLAVSEYTAVGREVRVWAGDRAMPPVLVFLFHEPIKDGGEITISGLVKPPVRDGKWRSPRHDFCVTVEDCTVIR